MRIGIVGNGFVGGATSLLVDNKNLIIYDKDETKIYPKNMEIKDLKTCSLIFICVPTPMISSGECYLGMVEDAVSSIKKIIDPVKTQIVLRSTVPPEPLIN